ESAITEKPVSLHIKATLENNNIWTLYSRRQGESCYRLEGSTTKFPVKAPQESGELTLNIEYTKTRYQHFAIDNLNVSYNITPTDTIPDDTPVDPDPEEPLPPDVVLPKLLSVEPLSLSELQFTFDQAVNITEAEFSISDIGKANRVTYADDEEMTIVNTRYSKEMVAGVEYTISYKGITDKEGNKLSSFSQEFKLEEEGEEATSGSVRINEIMADPKGLKELSETEYVELYNKTANVISLAGWQFSYGGKAKSMGSFEIPANGYAVLFRSGRDIKIDPSAIKVPLDNFPSQLANAGKQLQLLDASGKLIDEVTYDKAKPGKSWERSSDGWHLSSDPRGGTPGSANSSGQGEPEQPEKPVEPDKPAEPEIPDDPSVSPTIKVEPKEFIFNELLPNPFAGGSEYFELYNRSDRSLPLSGLSVAVRKTDGTLSTRYPLSSINTLIEPDGYAVLTKSVEGVADFYMVTSPAALFEISKLPILANTSSTLVLFRTEDGTIIDEVSYSSKWHASSVKDQKGVALERIDPEAETQSPSNWTSASATAGYGTPGYRNSQSDISFPNEPDKPTGIEAPEWVPGSKHYKITYYLDQPGYSCRAFVFNTIGQRVAEIANHELLGLSGELTWDGASLAGSHLRTGVYIFYAELYHTSGTVKRYKQVFLVR
ncbi:MAG: lamin tail domain-containing protein, partial [Parabacteroides gordonii]|uniref:lamin tail domain-containing protein n=1 Tax=Parabacteroides gordonii TaxID=574930 RepID=UPI003A8BE2B0